MNLQRPESSPVPAWRRIPAGSTRLLAVVSWLAAAPVVGQWSTQSPLPTFLDVQGVAAPAPGRLFLATDDDSFDDSGALFESTDDGATWLQREIPVDHWNGLWGIQFLDSQRGWVWGNRNYRTTDGGTTWEELPFLGSTYFMKFHSESFGVAAGNVGSYVSLDGELAWTESPHDLSTFSFASDLLGLGAAESGLYRTGDGGETFALVQPGEGQAVAFLSPAAAVAIVDGTLYRSTDGGSTWTPGPSAAGRSEIFALSAEVALAWGRSGTYPDFDHRLLRTADGGETWTDLGEVIDPGPNAAEAGFVAVSPQVVIASDGAGKLYRSADAGLTWAPVFATPGPTPGYFPGGGAPVFTDAQTGYFGFGAGFVIRSTDGGSSWSQISSGSGASVRDLGRFANGDLIAVDEAGQVLTSVGGNAPWRIRARPSPAALEAVQVLGPQAVVAVDHAGVVYRSSDAGATWTGALSEPDLVSAADLHFVSLTEGWVTGQGFEGAALFHTTDAGATWTGVPDFQGTYVAVDFAGATGWAAAVYGTLYRTLDGGGSWIESAFPGDPDSILALEFWNAGIGYAVGSGGYAARSSDGGASWQILPTPEGTGNLTDIALLGPDEIWVSGANGHVLYSATAGQSWSELDAGEADWGLYTAIAANPAGDAWLGAGRGLLRHFDGPPPPPVNWPPVASFDFLTTGLSVSFTDSSSDSDGSIVGWSWTFGDGATSTERHPTHLYGAAGSYHVLLAVTDDDGDTDLSGRVVVVQPGPGGTFGEFTEATPLDPLWVTPQDEDFWVSTAAPADYDGDGDLDIAVLGFYVVYNESVVNHLVLMRNEGPGPAGAWDFSYFEVPLDTLSPGASDLAWGDVDSDGDQDLAVGTDGATAIYRNDGGTLTRSDTELPGYWEDNDQADFDLRSITWADFDNDGDLDLLLPSLWDDEEFEFRTALMRNDGPNGSGGWIFTDAEAGLAPTGHAQSSWADFDGDQDLDLLLVHLAPLTDDGFIRRYRNDGAGGFSGEDILGGLTVEHGEAQWGDYDDDGDLDILVAGHIREEDGDYDTVLRIYRNDLDELTGAETYVPIEVIPCPACEGWWDLEAATWADYDSDGDIDILLAGTYNSGSQIEGRAKVYDNVDGVFADSGNQLPAPMSSGDRGGSFTWLDIDGEGDLDYFISGQYFVPGGNGLVEAQMHLYRNDASGENGPPSAPSMLDSAPQADGSVALWWQSASDDLTPDQALTYDLRVYRGGVPVSAASRLPEPGSLSAGGGWTLSGLPDGSYTWTLQAVDSAYNSGPPAQGTFFVGVPPDPLFADGFETGNASAWSLSIP